MKLLVLNRDGVLHRARAGHKLHWQPVPGSAAAIARAWEAGVRCVVFARSAAVEPDADGIEALKRLHREMLAAVRAEGGNIEAIFYCPHVPGTECNCDSPTDGLLAQIVQRTHIAAADVVVVGDCLADVKAARGIGAQAVLVQTGQGRATLRGKPDLRDTLVYESLAQAIEALVAVAT